MTPRPASSTRLHLVQLQLSWECTLGIMTIPQVVCDHGEGHKGRSGFICQLICHGECGRLTDCCMQMAQAGLAAEDEQAAIDACEIFIDLIEAPAPVLGPTIPDLVRWCLQVAATTRCDLATREMALHVSLCFVPVLQAPRLLLSEQKGLPRLHSTAEGPPGHS